MQWDALLKRNLKIRKLILYRIASDLPRLLSGESKILSFFLEYKQIFFGEGGGGDTVCEVLCGY